jgi:hypothetical protein
MMEHRKKRPFNKRVGNPPGLWLTPRDREVVKAVYEYRFLLRDQIQKLFFPSRNTANFRLHRLFQHGYLQRVFIPEDEQRNARSTQATYVLDKAGARLIGVDFKQARQVKPFFLKHLLKINDLRIALTLAVQKRGDRIVKWLPEWKLKKGVKVKDEKTGKAYPVSPDAYFVYELGHSGKRRHFLAEVDMGTMEPWRFGLKVKGYILYKTNGRYRQQYQTHSLIVPTLVPDENRLRRLKQITEATGGRNMFWFTTFEQLEPEKVLGPVWEIAGQEGVSKLLGD